MQRKRPPDLPGSATAQSRGHLKCLGEWAVATAIILAATSAHARPANPGQGGTGCPGRILKSELVNYERTGAMCQVTDSATDGDCDASAASGTHTTLCSYTGSSWEPLGDGGGAEPDVLTQPCVTPPGGGVSDAGEMTIFCNDDGEIVASADGSEPRPIALSEEGFVHSLPGAVPACFPVFGSSSGNALAETGLCISDGVVSYNGIVQAAEFRANSRAAANDNNFQLEKNIGSPACSSKCPAGSACNLYNQSGVYPQCNGTTQVGSNYPVVINFAVADDTWTDDNCWVVGSTATTTPTPVDVGCTVEDALFYAPADMVISKWCLQILEPTEPANTVGADIQLRVAGSTASTIVYNGAETFDATGEVTCTDISQSVTAGQLIQIRTHLGSGAGHCESGTCALPTAETVLRAIVFGGLS